MRNTIDRLPRNQMYWVDHDGLPAGSARPPDDDHSRAQPGTRLRCCVTESAARPASQGAGRSDAGTVNVATFHARDTSVRRETRSR